MGWCGEQLPSAIGANCPTCFWLALQRPPLWSAHWAWRGLDGGLPPPATCSPPHGVGRAHRSWWQLRVPCGCACVQPTAAARRPAVASSAAACCRERTAACCSTPPPDRAAQTPAPQTPRALLTLCSMNKDGRSLAALMAVSQVPQAHTRPLLYGICMCPRPCTRQGAAGRCTTPAQLRPPKPQPLPS